MKNPYMTPDGATLDDLNKFYGQQLIQNIKSKVMMSQEKSTYSEFEK